MKGKTLILILGIGAMVLVLKGCVWAQTSSALSISPLTFEININPGQSVKNIVKISNLTDGMLQIRMEAQDFTAAGEAGEVVVKEELSETYSMAKWISIDPETFELEPRSHQMVEFTVSAPVDAEPGGHYGTILASTIGGMAPGGAMVVPKVGALLLTQVAGEVEELLWVKTFEVAPFFEYGPVDFSLRFENQGTVHLKPRGLISIANWRGQEIDSLALPQKNVLPNSIREIKVSWDKHWLFGKYIATLTAIYGTTNEPISATVGFWVIPWKVLSVVLAVILVMTIFFYRTRKRWKTALRVLAKGESVVNKDQNKN